MGAILLMENDSSDMDANRAHLESKGYNVFTASTLREGENILETRHIDLIILGTVLPDGSGIGFCAKIRERYDIPVIFLTHLDHDAALIAGLKAGGDEYMTKPYSLAALSARAEALLRRVRMEKNSAKTISAGPLRIDCDKRKAYINGSDAALTPKEYDVLLLFAREMGSEFTIQEIFSQVWDGERFDGRTVIVHISSLRKKIQPNSEGSLSIATRKRKYYSLRVQ